MPTAISSVEPYIPSLNILPPEIRDQIWMLCLTPRTIQLNIHHHVKLIRKKLSVAKRFTKPPSKDAPLKPVTGVRTPRTSRPPATRPAGISFTATLVEDGKFPQFYTTEEEYTKAHRWSEACPAVPALLHVCRESRAIALKRYELILPGKGFLNKPNKPTPARLASEEAWIKRHIGPGRIWFDFVRDVLILHCPSKIDFHSRRRLSPLTNIVHHARDELHRIENLAIGLANAHALTSNRPGFFGYSDFERNIMSFTSLINLTIFDLSQDMFEPDSTSVTLPYSTPFATIPNMSTQLAYTLKNLRDTQVYLIKQRYDQARSDSNRDGVFWTQQMTEDFAARWPEPSPLPHLTVLKVPKL